MKTINLTPKPLKRERKKPATRAVFLWLSLFLFSTGIYANNLQITNLSIVGQDTALNYTLVQFDISWENSWRTSSNESNWDAAWVFVKFDLKGPTSDWDHATLNYVDGTAVADGHTQPAGSTIKTSPDGKGVMLYRDADGVGNVNYTTVQLRWNYGVDGLADNDSVEICALGIEMVYVPQGPFYAGDGSTTTIHRQFHRADNTTFPFLIESEAALTLGGLAPTSMGNNNGVGNGDRADEYSFVTTQNLPAAYPKGFNAFYCMKYEVSQGQYVDMVNKLTSPQSINRGFTTTNYRVNITGSWPSFVANAPYRPMTLLRWKDMAAYLDWAALRPMTELEYEKACRGDSSVGTFGYLPNEYAWGSTSITQATGVTNDGTATEIASPTNANAVYATGFGAFGSTAGPLRSGNFARAGTTTRDTTGATYYGIMDMSGNLWDWVVTTGISTGRNYTANHGDGLLTTAGEFTVTGWPALGTGWCYGYGFRGGSYSSTAEQLRVSSRNIANADFHDSWSRTQNLGQWRGYNIGFRGVRTD